MIGDLQKDLLRVGSAGLLVTMGNLGLNLVIAVMLARILGADGYGQYAFVFAVVTIIATPARMGMPAFVLRETARSDQAGDAALMRRVWRWSHHVVILATAVVLGLGALVILLFGSGAATPTAFFWGFMLVPLITLGGIRGAALRGLGRIVLGLLPERVLRPLFLVIFLCAVLAFGEGGLTAERALMLHVVAAALAFAVVALLLVRHAPKGDSRAPVRRSQNRTWLLSIGFLGAISGLEAINSSFDLVMLGLMRTDHEVGLYKVAATGAGLVSLSLQVLNFVIMPRIARYHSANETERMRETVTASARLVLAPALAVAAVLIVFGDRLLPLIFGEAFATTYTPLVILVLAQLASAAYGATGMLLTMSGHERDAFLGSALAATTNVVLNLALIPAFGMAGAAMATLVSILSWKTFLHFRVRAQLGIDSTAIGAHRKRVL